MCSFLRRGVKSGGLEFVFVYLFLIVLLFLVIFMVVLIFVICSHE